MAAPAGAFTDFPICGPRPFPPWLNSEALCRESGWGAELARQILLSSRGTLMLTQLVRFIRARSRPLSVPRLGAFGFLAEGL